MAANYEQELQELLKAWEPATGPTGFEGLVAVAVADVSGLPVRLARSGSQFGRDGLSTPGEFEIAFEAKRYTSRPTLQEMTTKAALAAYDLADEVDVWACAMPTDLGDLAAQLRAILEREGISLLALDWPTGGLSPLAVILAASRENVVSWARGLGRDEEADDLDRLLRHVEQETAFASAAERLWQELRDATAGLAALARANREWLLDVLADPDRARAVFGQRIAPIATGATAVAREDARAALAAQVRPAREGLTAVLGGEGTGKTWQVADWLLNPTATPIVLFAAGPFHAALDSQKSGEEMLAELLERQHGGTSERWLRRIRRWKQSRTEQVRFAVVIDGINERASGKRWASIIDALVRVVDELGGVLIVTSRPAYWRDNVSGRLRCTARLVQISNFNEEQLRAYLAQHGTDLGDLPADLHSLLANPRVAALAVEVLPRLPEIGTLSRDRLLLEYWRSRMEERGDFVAHNDDEFRDLLAAHARQFRETGSANFGRSSLSKLSSQVVFGGRSYDDDLAELAEGQFFSPRSGGYAVTGLALPTALGILLHADLVAAELTEASDALAFITAALEPVSGFDDTANAVAACVALALSEQSLPPATVAALIVAWFGIQNRDEDARRSIEASARVAPEAFLDALEAMPSSYDEHPLIELLHDIRDEPEAWTVMAPRLTGWMGAWSPQAELHGNDQRALDQQAERSGSIVAKRDSLRAEERALFERTTMVLANELSLPKAAVQLATGMPLAELAQGIVGFVFVGAIKGHGPLHELFSWMLRSNAQDFEATREAVRDVIAPIGHQGSSPAAKQAAALALEALGTQVDAKQAEILDPRQPSRVWRRVDALCDADPLDPAAGPPTNLANARNAAQAIDPAEVWTNFSTTSEDHRIEEITPGLARFDLPFFSSLIRSIVRTGPERRGMHLRQLAWHLPQLSALLEEPDIAAIKDIIAGLSNDGREVPPEDRWWILAMATEALLPHLSFTERAELVGALPARVPAYDRLARQPADTDAETIEELLECGERGGSLALKRALHLLGTVSLRMTPRSRELVVRFLGHSNPAVASLAADIVRRAADDELDRLALADGSLELKSGRDFLRAHRSAAFASAVVRQERRDLVPRIELAELGWAAGKLAGEALRHYRDTIDAALDQLLRPIATIPPPQLEMHVETDADGRERRFSVNVREPEAEDNFAAFQAAVQAHDDEHWREQRRLATSELRSFVQGVTLEGTGALVDANWLHGLDELVADDIDHAGGWAERIISAEAVVGDQAQALGAAIAAALSFQDPELAARLFRRVLKANAIIDTLIGRAKIPLRLHALFRAPPHPALDELRTELFIGARNDAEIEAMAAAASAHRADAVLDAVVASLLSSAVPTRQALALTITGLRRRFDGARSILDDDHGPGFLGDVAEAARDRARRMEWFERWRDEALQADDPAVFWRAAYLAAECVDRRCLVDRLELREGSPAWLNHAGWMEQLGKGAEKRTKERNDLLFGLRKPWR